MMANASRQGVHGIHSCVSAAGTQGCSAECESQRLHSYIKFPSGLRLRVRIRTVRHPTSLTGSARESYFILHSISVL